MRRRTRFLAGTLALAAMTLSFAETVLASTCAPMPEGFAAPGTMRAMPGMAAGTPEAAEGHTPGPDCMKGMNHGPRQDDGPDEHGCPLNPAMTQGCSAAASLPAPAADPVPSASSTTLRIVSPTVHPSLLLANALFHPPRA